MYTSFKNVLPENYRRRLIGCDVGVGSCQRDVLHVFEGAVKRT